MITQAKLSKNLSIFSTFLSVKVEAGIFLLVLMYKIVVLQMSCPISEIIVATDHFLILNALSLHPKDYNFNFWKSHQNYILPWCFIMCKII